MQSNLIMNSRLIGRITEAAAALPQGNHRDDLLSELPESLIVHILSSLEMKDAVKTSVLSKRWKNLWTQVQNIVYVFCPLDTQKGYTSEELDEDRKAAEDEELYKQKLQAFISFVDRTLLQCTCPNINMFTFRGLHCQMLNVVPMNENIDRWISFVVEKNVKCIRLDLQEEMEYAAPDCFYRSSSLTELNLTEIETFDVIPSPLSWRLLKSLSLWRCPLNDDGIANILSGSPVLENIHLDGVLGIKSLNITSPSVKKLTMLYIEHADVQADEYMKINAPWLEELDIRGSFFIPRCQVLDISSLKKATLYFNYSSTTTDDDENGYPYGAWWNDMVYDVLIRFSHVGDLIIGIEVLQALAVSNLLGKRYPLFKCKQLKVISPIWKNDLYAIACLLQNTPYLEKLSIKLRNWQRFIVMPYASHNLDGRDLHLWLPQANCTNLKSVEIEYLVEWCPKEMECFDFELVEHILSNSCILEKLVLLTTGDECFNCPDFCICRNAPRLASKLVSSLLVEIDTMDWEMRKIGSDFVFKFLNYEPIAEDA